ncbi:MAG: hypothetical protein ACE10H_08725 [Candidatus Binatia bacterium]
MAGATEPKFMIVSLWDDQEIGARIYLQACNLFVGEFLLKEQKDRFFTHAFAVMHKLSATKYHLENYRRMEADQLDEANRQFSKDPSRTKEAFELIFELEAFLFQVKSSLDMVVKLLRPILGEHVVKTHTYGNKGEDLIKGLKQHRKKKGVNLEAVDRLIDLAEMHKEGWLQRTVELRDELSHIEGLRNYQYRPMKITDGRIVAQKPRFKNFETLETLEIIYQNNLFFHQDFMAFSLALLPPPGIVLRPKGESEVVAGFPPEVAKYIRWCWRMVLPST